MQKLPRQCRIFRLNRMCSRCSFLRMYLCQTFPMRNLTTAICLTIAVLLGSGGVSWSADFQKGLAAAQRGDFATALRQWKPVPSIYSIVPPNDGSALRHGHHFEPVDFVIDHGRGHHDAYSAGSCEPSKCQDEAGINRTIPSAPLRITCIESPDRIRSRPICARTAGERHSCTQAAPTTPELANARDSAPLAASTACPFYKLRPAQKPWYFGCPSHCLGRLHRRSSR